MIVGGGDGSGSGGGDGIRDTSRPRKTDAIKTAPQHTPTTVDWLNNHHRKGGR
jgi:hypothetical protein